MVSGGVLTHALDGDVDGDAEALLRRELTHGLLCIALVDQMTRIYVAKGASKHACTFTHSLTLNH